MALSNVQELLEIAHIVNETGTSNYKQARIPIKSGLNIEAWEENYPDTRLIQYLKFGFPLSITKGKKLGGGEVTNHYSALQYPGAVTQYLDKERDLGAILGAVRDEDKHLVHCSPLLTRPKDNNSKHRVILDLSFPPGQSGRLHSSLSLTQLRISCKPRATRGSHISMTTYWSLQKRQRTLLFITCRTCLLDSVSP